MQKKEHTIIEHQTLIWDFDTGIEGQATQISSLPASPAQLEETNDILVDRYENKGLLGSGGMGQVLQVYDRKLQRHLALKIINSNLVTYPIILNLFLKEAQTTAILQHPGILPVHDFGQLPDGRYYFTMKKLEGTTLKDIIRLLHKPRTPIALHELKGDWSMQRLLQVFARVCETLGYAHTQGVLHRDIKPDNIMLGSHGEVLLVDWGVSKLLPRGIALFNHDSKLKPRQGSVIGTPIYMSPEQANGESPEVAEPSDVFSLGAVLYEILTGREPRSGRADKLLEDASLPLPSLPSTKYIDATLKAIYRKATSVNPLKRYGNAKELYHAIQSFLEGSAKRYQAELLVTEAQTFRVNIQIIKQKITALTTQIKQDKMTIEPWHAIEIKQNLWNMEDELRTLILQSNLLEANFVERLHTALNYCPDFVVAHQKLADFYHEKHQEAEALNDHLQAPLMAQLMTMHDTGRYQNYLRGISNLQLSTNIQTEIEIFRFEEKSRRLELKSIWKGQSPVNIELEIGSYLAHIKALGHSLVRLPFSQKREAPTILCDIPLPLKDQIDDKECYIPEGFCYIGSKDEPRHPRKKVHLPAFCIQKYSCTNRQYILFLNSLASQGREEEALLNAPRTRGIGSELGEQIYGYSEETKKFSLKADSEGDCWELNWPVILVNAHNAEAYAKWYSEQVEQLWTLATCWQWEKAARGVDERKLPWGDHFEPTWANVRGSQKGRALPTSIYEHPLDISPFGVYGMAGNVQDFCLDLEDESMVYSKGGAWSHHPEFIDMATLRNFPKNIRLEVAGFRLARLLEI